MGRKMWNAKEEMVDIYGEDGKTIKTRNPKQVEWGDEGNYEPK